MLTNNMQLKVRNIIGQPVDGMVRVTVDEEVFRAIRQSTWARKNRQTPLLNYKLNRDLEGNYDSTFNFNGAELHAISSTEQKRLYFFMKNDEAKARYFPLEKEAPTPIALSKFDLSIVATA